VGRGRRSTTGRVTRSESQLIKSLEQQFELLSGACGRYDGGDPLETLNIATRLRVILEGPTSLLVQLRLVNELPFMDTSTHRLDPDRHPCIANLGVKIEAGVGGRWLPLGDGWPDGQPRPPDALFATWWKEPILPKSTEDGFEPTPSFSRRQLVLAVANQDGGTHVLPRDADYDALTTDSFAHEVGFHSPTGEVNFYPMETNASEACIRQIGHEVLRTLERNLPPIINQRRRGLSR
jgi:hypothetical protein